MAFTAVCLSHTCQLGLTHVISFKPDNGPPQQAFLTLFFRGGGRLRRFNNLFYVTQEMTELGLEPKYRQFPDMGQLP